MPLLASDPKTDAERAEWSELLDALAGDVERWGKAQGWTVERIERDVDERHLGCYTVPVVVLVTEHDRLFVDPVALRTLGGDGRVDLYAYPSFHRMLLLRRGSEWRLTTDSGIEWPAEWSEETFVDVANRLTAAR